MALDSEISRIALLVTQTLENYDIRYAVGGSLASSLHGVMRSTLDVDIVADLLPEHIPLLVAALSEQFYADGEMMRNAIEREGSFNLIHYDTAFKVDIFISKERPFSRTQLERRELTAITADPDRTIYITTPEDTILAKLEWYRLGGEASDRQWRDILGVLKTRAGDLDLGYMRRWAAELEVEDLLERALREA
ncbi:MAG: hypothetical protein LC131_05975 [Anaerolineae bacterium]|nr:hypothetical protein [Anaerolineae bacterium]